MEVLELRGYKALRAFNAFHTLMLGMKMLPMHAAESYETFFERVEAMPDGEQERLLRQAALFVELQKDEVECLVSFVADPNGVPYGPAQLKKMSHDQIFEIIVAVCLEIIKIKVTLVNKEEKKNLPTSQLTSEKYLQGIPTSA